MLTLYMKPTCPFCRRVVAVVERLELEVEMKDINDEAIAAELVERGGKQMVPYLVDTDKDVEMYESDDIVAHLQTNYGTPTPKVHRSNDVCIACEG